MKKICNHQLIPVSIVCLFYFFITSCDKYDLNFTTQNEYALDHSSHTLVVHTKQENPFINYIEINGELTYIARGKKLPYGSHTIDFGHCKATYFSGQPVEVKGEWFDIKVTDAYTFTISISENNDIRDRELTIELTWKSASNKIHVFQRKNPQKKDELRTSLKEAKFISDLFMSSKNKSILRSKNTATSSIEIKETSTIQSNQNTLMYVFNYTKGFTVISASKKMFPILAYSDEGAFKEDPTNLGLSEWLNCMKDDVEDNLNTSSGLDDLSSTNKYHSLKSILLQHDQDLDVKTRAVECFDEIRNHIRVNPVINTKWKQGSPYNKFTPIINGHKAPAGCVPIAIAQAVNYHKRLFGESIDWDKVGREDPDAIAELIHAISRNIGMKYTKEYAHPQINVFDPFDYRKRVVNFLRRSGYNANFRDAINRKPIVCPSIVEGFTENFLGGTNWFNGHWWVLAGYESFEVYQGCGEVAEMSVPTRKSEFISYSALYFYFNWGWGEHESNGWYGVSQPYSKFTKSVKRLDITI